MADQKGQAARLVLDTMPALMQAVASEMRHTDHPMPMPHFGTLMALSRRSCTLSELAERRKVSLPTMSKTIGILEANGWVERVADENDRRKADLILTEAGADMVRHVEDSIVELLTRLFEPLSASEIERLMDGVGVLQRVARNRQSGSTETEGTPA